MGHGTDKTDVRDGQIATSFNPPGLKKFVARTVSDVMLINDRKIDLSQTASIQLVKNAVKL